MPYGAPHDRYYSNIFAPAVVEAGLDPVRADSMFRSVAIMGDIWRLTREAKVLLADLTGKNANVFYELGLAHAIGKPVVLVANSIDDVPFDLRALRVLIYDKDDETWGTSLQDNLVRALEETLNDLTSAVPLPFLEAKPAEGPKEDSNVLEFRRLWDEIRTLRAQLPNTQVPTTRTYELPPVTDPRAIKSARDWIGDTLPAPLPDEAIGTLLSYLAIGQWIQGIKFLREVTGLGLREAKGVVDHLRELIPRLHLQLSP